MANKNNHTFVKNINGTGSEPYCDSSSKTESSWLKTADGEGKDCAVLGCGDSADVGAHVMNTDGRADNSWNIVPMCATHNNTANTEEMPLCNSAEMTKLV